MQHNGGICSMLCIVIVVIFQSCLCHPVHHSLSTIPDEYIRRGTLYCKKVTCTIDTYVTSCKTNGSRDECVPCPEDTEMKDNTTSRQHNIQCVRKKQCPPETRPVNYTVKCRPSLPGHNLPCECDRSRGYCGVDPCNCKPMSCLFGYYLEQNCGCSLRDDLESSSITTTRQPSTTEALSTTKDSSEQRAYHSSSLSTSSNQVDTYVFNSSTERPTTKSILDTTESSSVDQITFDVAFISVGVIALTVLIIIVICWICRKIQLSKGDGNHHEIHYHGDKIYNATNMQFGERSVNYQNVPESDNEYNNEIEQNNDNE